VIANHARDVVRRWRLTSMNTEKRPCRNSGRYRIGTAPILSSRIVERKGKEHEVHRTACRRSSRHESKRLTCRIEIAGLHVVAELAGQAMRQALDGASGVGCPPSAEEHGRRHIRAAGRGAAIESFAHSRISP